MVDGDDDDDEADVAVVAVAAGAVVGEDDAERPSGGRASCPPASNYTADRAAAAEPALLRQRPPVKLAFVPDVRDDCDGGAGYPAWPSAGLPEGPPLPRLLAPVACFLFYLRRRCVLDDQYGASLHRTSRTQRCGAAHLSGRPGRPSRDREQRAAVRLALLDTFDERQGNNLFLFSTGLRRCPYRRLEPARFLLLVTRAPLGRSPKIALLLLLLTQPRTHALYLLYRIQRRIFTLCGLYRCRGSRSRERYRSNHREKQETPSTRSYTPAAPWRALRATMRSLVARERTVRSHGIRSVTKLAERSRSAVNRRWSTDEQWSRETFLFSFLFSLSLLSQPTVDALCFLPHSDSSPIDRFAGRERARRFFHVANRETERQRERERAQSERDREKESATKAFIRRTNVPKEDDRESRSKSSHTSLRTSTIHEQWLSWPLQNNGAILRRTPARPTTATISFPHCTKERVDFSVLR